MSAGLYYSAEVGGLRASASIDAVDDVLERLDLVSYDPDNDPDIDVKTNAIRCLASCAADIRDYVDYSALPSWGANITPPLTLPEYDFLRDEFFRIREGLIAYGLVFGLDMLEDAVNSGVPLEDILA